MKPVSIQFDSVFEKRWQKYLAGLKEKQKENLRKPLAIFKENILKNYQKAIG